MDDTRRLELIVETVAYCQKIQKMGMPASCYTKALREPIHFLWERRLGTKIQIAQFRSKAAVGLSFGKRELVFDHAIPFNYLQKALLLLDPLTASSVKELLDKFGTICLITKAEDDKLNKNGLNREMPKDWDRVDPFARYKAVDIELIENCVS